MRIPLTLLAIILTGLISRTQSVSGQSAIRQSAVGGTRPNILYFYVDDMGWGSIGPNGQELRRRENLPYVRTPHLNQLAADGVNFQRGYACPVCSPSRASQQSGFHQGHAFADRNDPNNAKKAMRRDDVLIGDALAAAGYVTGYWGKWGFGGSKDLPNPVIENVQTLPTSHGYQHVLAELHHVRAHTFFQPTLWKAPAAAGSVGGLQLVPNSMSAYQRRPQYPPEPALQNHPAYPDTGYCDDAYAFAALDFVRTQAQNYHRTGQPFFGLLAVQIPHAPFAEITQLPDWDRAYAGDSKFASLADQSRQWAAMVTRIDAHFGNILAALEDPNNDGDRTDSIARDTLVVFQSDNGGPRGPNNEQLDANGGLRGNKGQVYEGGIRVPLVMRWPARIHADSELKAGSTSQMVVDITDLLPTFCDLADAPTPLGIDGVSIAPTLRGTGRQRKRDFIIHESGNMHSIIRGRYKLVRNKRGAVELYDLDTDHAESLNIAADHPELVRQLETLLLQERVTEPKGFAATYHHWVGPDGGEISHPDHWSDYRYENAGITYLSDSGAPRLSWIAQLANPNSQSRSARAAADLEFLALGIRGNSVTKASQLLTVDRGQQVTGRNEIRIAAHGHVQLDGGRISSLRWIDVQPHGSLSGSGRIDGIVYNAGRLEVSIADRPGIDIDGGYHQAETGTITVPLTTEQDPAFRIRGEASLAGQLKLTVTDGIRLQPGQAYPILTAERLTGSFQNPDQQVVTAGGVRLKILYTDSAVAVTPDSNP